MKKYLEIMEFVVLNTKLNLYVAESHYFDAKGNRQLTLTDDYRLAEKMTLIQANRFLSSVKNSTDYEITEAVEENEEVYEDEED